MHTFEPPANQLHSMLDWVRWATSRFHEANLHFGHGTDNAWDEAMSLVLQVLHLPQTMLAAKGEQLLHSRLSNDEKQQVQALIEQRVEQRVPLAYLTNQCWFAGLPFYVDERVLVPRSPFAELIEQGFAPYLQQPPTHIMDLCTGSGCIAIALAYAFPHAQVDALDISEDALAVADININEHQLTGRVFPIQSDLLSAVKGQQYDLIVSNPPYVDAEDMADLPDEFRHEPELGLAAGHDGLDLVEQMLADAHDCLTDQGWLFVEVGNSQVHMAERFRGLQPEWIEFKQGGSGVFALNKAQLADYLAQAASQE